MDGPLSLSKQQHMAIVTMNNPPANTWTLESLNQLAELVMQLNSDREVYSLILTGQGEKFFSAGADLKLFADGDDRNARQMAEAFGRAFEALSEFRGLSIAAINGYAMGGGLEVALACDLRIVEAHAALALPEASVGLLPCAGGTQNLPHLVGEGWAKRMILCGERVDAELAVQIGLAEAMEDSGGALDLAMKWAHQAQKQSPLSVAACKRLIQQSRKSPLWDGLHKERDEFVALFGSHDQQEGVTAFLDKRKPEWTNR